MIKPDYISRNGRIRFYNCDCMELMSSGKMWDLAVVDPPYSINFSGYERGGSGKKTKERYTKSGKKGWDNQKPQKEYFNMLKKISENQIIWGYNHLADLIGSCSNFIFWYKRNPVPNFSDGELAYTSFDGVSKCFDYMYYGNINSEKTRIHETQKPIQLYRWIFKNYAKPTDHIIDTHGGSMSSAIAAHMEGLELDICELDKDYFYAAVNRFKIYEQQLTLF